MTYELIIYHNRVQLNHVLRIEVFDTTGPDDPRIAEAIARCRAAGYHIHVTRI